jgi:hypothetical protein
MTVGPAALDTKAAIKAAKPNAMKLINDPFWPNGQLNPLRVDGFRSSDRI